MGLLNTLLRKLPKRRKPLAQMSRSELRRQELLLEKERARLLTRLAKLAGDKQTLFERGSQEKSVELRRSLAQEFELRTSEQVMVGRQLNLRSKEMMTVSRLRMLRENADRAGRPGQLGLVSPADILKLERLIETDAVKGELYQQRLDEILSAGAAADDGSLGLSEAGQSVLRVWERMDAGALTDPGVAFDEADRGVRERQAMPEV